MNFAVQNTASVVDFPVKRYLSDLQRVRTLRNGFGKSRRTAKNLTCTPQKSYSESSA